MKNTKLLFGATVTALLAVGSLTGCVNNRSGADKYDKDGRLILELKNVYFEGFTGDDMYTDILNEKFGVKIKPSNYEYDNWDEAVNISMNGNNLTDAIQFNLKAYNFGSTYEKWVKKMMIKALPDDMSKWPNLKAMMENSTNIDALKVNGKLYGIPVANDISNYQKDFSNMTYVYRRDWAKEIDEANKDVEGYKPIYREGDVYTWEEFNNLLLGFKAHPHEFQKSVIVDESWGFPSVTNFYKDAPHCFAKDENGKAINAFTSDKYISGLEVAKEFVMDKHYYSEDQFNFKLNEAKKAYLGDKAAVFYDNFSLSNYISFRKDFKGDSIHKNVNLDDATAFLKVKGPNGKFALEGTENWFSMTMFNYDISDFKMEKILDILDYLLTEEGTRLAIYGKEGYDYNIVDGEIELSTIGWEKDSKGNYIKKNNGAKFMRYMATLGNDTKPFDPLTEMDAFTLFNNWGKEMKAAKDADLLKVVKEPDDISWMSTETKNDKTEALLEDANTFALKYSYNYGSFTSIEAYKNEFNKNVNWKRVLDEINAKLGK